MTSEERATLNAMTFDEFMSWINARSVGPDAISDGQRYGQRLFNVLYEIRPDISERLRATRLDPFYCEQHEIRPDVYELINQFW